MAEIPENANITILNRNEKKAREMISKLGLKKVPGIIRVTFRKKDNQIYAIEKPEVFRSAGGNYVVFGEPKVDNFTQRLAAAQQQASQQQATKTPEDIQADLQAAADANEGAKTEDAPAADDENVDVGDLNPDDVDLVIQQTNASKGQAVKALKEHNGDIVNAIMSLSK